MLNHQVFQAWNKNKFKRCFKRSRSFRNLIPSSCAFKNTFKEKRLSLGMHMIPLGLYIKIIQKVEGSKRGTIVSLENEFSYSWKIKLIHENKVRHAHELEWKKRKLVLLLMSLQSSDYNRSIPLSLTGIWTELQIIK